MDLNVRPFTSASKYAWSTMAIIEDDIDFHTSAFLVTARNCNSSIVELDDI
jgi:hypothetical protein